jgi:hypothetical protein
MSQSDQCFDKYFVLANFSKLLGIKRYTFFRQADRNHTFWPFWLAWACVGTPPDFWLSGAFLGAWESAFLFPPLPEAKVPVSVPQAPHTSLARVVIPVKYCKMICMVEPKKISAAGKVRFCCSIAILNQKVLRERDRGLED